jgi:maltose-binding protein MalE
MLLTTVLYLTEVQELRLQTTTPIITVDQIQITNKTRSKTTILQEEKVVVHPDLIRQAQVIQAIQDQVMEEVALQVEVEEDLQEAEEEQEVKIQKHLYQ